MSKQKSRHFVLINIMKEAVIIFPHQLFKEHPAIKTGRPIYLVEEFLFFRHYNFHKQKLILHRASMKAYEAFLLKRGFDVTYVEAHEEVAKIALLVKKMGKLGFNKIHFADVADNWLNKRMTKAAALHQIETGLYDSPNFLNSKKSSDVFFDKKKTYFQTAFYVDQRKKRNILLDAGGNPEGGQWSFDADNREKFPKSGQAPVLHIPADNTFVKEARRYVEKNFKDNYGNAEPPFAGEMGFYPVTFEEAAVWLDNFLKTRFAGFGKYEDAIVANESFLHHSVISPLLNIGLLSPQQVIDRALESAARYAVPLNSTEGFIRQVIGWREFIRIVYEREGSKQRTKNYWGFTKKIPASFWNGTTGIEPIDNTIKKIIATGYCHHIERLMLLGNFMLLCEFDPDDVYRWFMEMFVDSYDWVMVPNVYGMTQFADGGLMTTKPYISGSNYVMKMSDFKKGAWQETWDGLFWRFMDKQRNFFLKNPRLGMLVHSFDKMTEEKRQNHWNNAERFLQGMSKDV